MSDTQLSWIHLAGNPRSVERKQPPYWRIRMASSGEIHPVTAWTIEGEMTSGNNLYGTEIGASFLLWWALYGRVDFREGAEGCIVAIKMEPQLATEFPGKRRIVKRYPSSTIRIFGAPDLVNARAGLHWRGVVANDAFDLASFVVKGAANQRNIMPGENLLNEQPYQSLWLEIAGHISIRQDSDQRQHATILLSSRQA
jgi:hypothetical protein